MSIISFEGSKFDSDSNAQRREALRDLRRQQRIHAAERSGLLELDRANLTFGRFDVVTDASTSIAYRLHRGELVDAIFTAVVAFFRTADGADVVFLEAVPQPGAHA